MTAIVKQDSNQTGLRIALEASPGVLPGSPVWIGYEPNNYANFGGDFIKVARMPINASRQRKKGVVVDLNASGGFAEDLTYERPQSFIEGIMFADFRVKSELAVTGATSGHFTVAAGGLAYKAGDVVFAKSMQNAVNNGRFTLAADATGTSIAAPGVTAEAGSAGIISRVGHTGASGDLVSVFSGGVQTLTSTALDFTTLGLIVGEWIFVDNFGTAGANGFKRLSSIAAHTLTFDKSSVDPAADAGTATIVTIYFGRVIRNEQAALIKRRTYQMERTLGKADTTSTFEQVEYLVGSTLNQWTLTLNTADKLTWSISTVSQRYQLNDSATGPKSGARPAIVENKAFNSTSHVARMRVGGVGDNTAFFAHVIDGTFSINNNVVPNKAIGTLGSFDQTAGFFEVSAALNVYFSTVEAIQAIGDNADVSIDAVLCQDNQGIIIDFPLVSLGDGRLKVAINEPITLPLTCDAADATSVNVNMDYTAMLMFFDYLPDSAMPNVV